MPVSLTLGRLQPVPLRDAWANEAGDFTPWLANGENIALLGDALGLSLEVESTEQAVGPYRADIVCRNLADDSLVLIENQVEQTDHSHLGQLVTYAAGLGASTLIWIARRFTDEHRAAVDWLNTVTNSKLNVFALEIELWKIGDSAAAPKFNVVSQPNEWTRSAPTLLTSQNLSAARQRQHQYWTAFKDVLTESGSRLRTSSPRPESSFDIALGRAGIYLRAATSPYDAVDQSSPNPHVRAQLTIESPESAGLMRALLARRNEIEEKIGQPLVWMPIEDGPRRKRAFISLPADIENPSDWPRQHTWLKDTIEKMATVFAPIVRELVPLAESVASGSI